MTLSIDDDKKGYIEQAECVLIQEQEKEHREISQSLQEAIPRLEEAKKMSEALTPLIGKTVSLG